MKTFEEGFSIYRETVGRECPVCSDLFHGYRAGHMYQQEKINKLQADLDKAVDIIERVREILNSQDHTEALHIVNGDEVFYLKQIKTNKNKME